MTQNKKISIIIPAYNEEKRVGDTLDKILAYKNEHELDLNVVVVDDGSTDSTVEIVKSKNIQVIQQIKNQGKGAAVRRGMLEADGDIILFSDADLSTPIYEIEKLLPYFYDGYDICIGSRALKDELIKEHQPWYREFMGKTFNRIVQTLVLKGIQDTQCGFKAFTKESARKIFRKSRIDGFAFDVEALYLASRYNFKVKEIPVEWYNDERSKVDPIKDSLKMLGEILKIRKIHKKKDK